MTEPALRTENLTKRFGGLTAVGNLNLSIPSGRLHAIIGPNGAGKTTFFNLVSGLLAADKGRVFFKGRDITGLQPHEVSRLGIKRTMQIKSVFPQLTVAENLWVTRYATNQVLHPLRSASRDPETRDLSVSGIGGITTWRDAAEFIALGSGSVQVCTAAMAYGFRIVTEMISGLSNWMDEAGHAKLVDFEGLATRNFTELVRGSTSVSPPTSISASPTPGPVGSPMSGSRTAAATATSKTRAVSSATTARPRRHSGTA